MFTLAKMNEYYYSNFDTYMYARNALITIVKAEVGARTFNEANANEAKLSPAFPANKKTAPHHIGLK